MNYIEPIKTVNGVPLTSAQANTLRIAIEAFASMMRGGLLDERLQGQRIRYLTCIEELRTLLY